MISQEVHDLVSRVYDSLNNYCLNNCNAECCRGNSILVKPDEVDRVTKRNRSFILGTKRDLIIISTEPKCPSLDGNKCSIYEQRPDICRNWPIKAVEDEGEIVIVFYKGCRAVRQGLSQTFIDDAKARGYVAMS
jgi:Fe-S-cluster containining protein